MKHLVESALLTHGLKSIRNDDIKDIWKSTEENIAWVSEGQVVIGNIDKYLEFRAMTDSLLRIDCDILEQALTEGRSGALTASGTMAVCRKLGIPLAVTCGMGGIGDIKGEELCPDLPALTKIPVTLVTTGPKDMLKRQETITWLREHDVSVFGTRRNYCTGYVFIGDKVALDGVYDGTQELPALIIHEIPEEERVQDYAILAEAVAEGKRAEREGRYYHPAANGKIDELTEGYSSRIQLRSLYANAMYAQNMK